MFSPKFRNKTKVSVINNSTLHCTRGSSQKAKEGGGGGEQQNKEDEKKEVRDI